MKFFDLEFSGIAKNGKRRGGSRDVTYAEGEICKNFKYTHGTHMEACLSNAFNYAGASQCETTIEPIQK